MKFTHLHTHSHYSLLDGLPKIGDLLDYAKEIGMDSLALTDHGNMYGVVEFFVEAKKKGIKPIIGVEAYVASGKYDDFTNITNNNNKRDYRHLIILVKNKKGYQNLVKLVTESYLRGFYYRPRIDEELLERYSEGLIITSACLAGKIPQLILSKEIKEIEKTILKYQSIFKDDFYLELQYHPLPEQKIVNEKLVEYSKKFSIKLIASNDIHYLKKEDNEIQDILLAINTGHQVDDANRLTMKDFDLSMLSPKEMIENFKKDGLPLEAISNTQEIVEKCNFEFEIGKFKIPSFLIPDNKNADEYLRELAYQGIKKRYPDANNQKIKEIKDRLNYELSVVKELKFDSYFLIVQDFINWSKKNKIVVGPGRGSTAGCIISYLLGITNIDPLKYGLIFERFLTPGRKDSPPDFDLDFADHRRDEVFNYISEKYGQGKVAQIITFGTIAARAGIRDVGRVLNYPYSYCDRLAKMVPMGFTLDKTLNEIKEFREVYETDSEATKLIDLAKKLEGVIRHASTHACGLIISDQLFEEIIPMQKSSADENIIISQYDMYSVVQIGFLKMDILGLKNLTIIEKTLETIKKRHNIDLDIENIKLDDKKTFKLLQQGKTISVFQLESGGMRRFLKEMKPDKIDNIIAQLALYRPGPLQFFPTYINRKQNKEKITYLDSRLEPILKETYGLAIYQEQILKIVQVLAGFTLAEADVLRRAIGKKIKELLDSQKEKFINGVIVNGANKQIAIKLWEWILPFASYGFNKCLTKDVEILSSTGNIRTVEELYIESKFKKPYRNMGKSVISLNKDLKLKSDKILNIVENGIKPIYQIETFSGRKIKATQEHKFYLFNGWKELKELRQGDRIAVARYWPITDNKIKKEWPWYKFALLGQVLSEGNTCHPSGFYLYTNSEEELREYIKILKKFENTKVKISKREGKRGKYVVYIKRVNLKYKSEAVEFIMNELKLKNKKAVEKFIPNIALKKLTNKNAKILLGAMWNGDGCIDVKNNIIYYATSSQKLAKQIQNILLRFRIISKLYEKKFNYKDTVKIGWTVNLSRYDNILKFSDNIGDYLVGKRRDDLKKLLNSYLILQKKNDQLSTRGTSDTIPIEIQKEIREECKKMNIPMKVVAKWAKVSSRLFNINSRKNGFQRETLSKIANILESKNLKNLAESDIYWDKIKNIRYIGKEETYDLSIEKDHNFIANGFIVHNSHATGYALIAYQTAYLKAHYPTEFMASVLNSEKDAEKFSFLIDECKNFGVNVLPPEINESKSFFTVVDNGKIRFGMNAIKNVGQGIVDIIINERKKNGNFNSFSNFLTRVKDKDLNKRSLESLIKAGVFDKLEKREKLLYNMEYILDFIKELKQHNNNGKQVSLFNSSISFTELKLKEAEKISEIEKLGYEKELLGIYISGHPLDSYKKILEKSFPISKISKNNINKKIQIGGIVSMVKKVLTKTGQQMFFIKVEDLTGNIDVIVFPKTAMDYLGLFEEGKIIFVYGNVNNKDGEIKILAERVEEIIKNP